MTKGYEPFISTQVILGGIYVHIFLFLPLFVCRIVHFFLAQSSLGIGSIPIVPREIFDHGKLASDSGIVLNALQRGEPVILCPRE